MLSEVEKKGNRVIFSLTGTEHMPGFPMVVYSRYEWDLSECLLGKGEESSSRLMPLLLNSLSQLLTCGNQGYGKETKVALTCTRVHSIMNDAIQQTPDFSHVRFALPHNFSETGVFFLLFL